MAVIQIAHNAVNAKLVNAPRDVKLAVSELLSYEVEGYEHTYAFKSSGWDGRSTFFSFKKSVFPAGFVELVRAKLERLGHSIQILRKPLPKPMGSATVKVDDFLPDPRYDFHDQTIERLLQKGQMIAQVATGGGKSRIARLAYGRIKRPTLFLTTRSVLMHQMKRSFETDMNLNVGVLGNGVWKPVNGINVGMVQTLTSYIQEKNCESEIERILLARKKKDDEALKKYRTRVQKEKITKAAQDAKIQKYRKTLSAQHPSDERLAKTVQSLVRRHNRRRDKVIDLLSRFELVILEEAHESSGNSFYDVMRHCTSAYYRLALTATPFMRADAESNMRLMACAGVIGIKVSEKMLIDRGILAKPYFKYVKTPKPPKVFRTTSWQRAYKLGVVESGERNRLIAAEAIRAAKLGLNVMILVQHTAHGKTIQAMLNKYQANLADFIYGKHEQDKRHDALKRLESGQTRVLIGTSILDVGVDVPALGMVILAGAGKAEINLRQRVGRGLRAKKKGPNVALIVDYIDDSNEHLLSHSLERRRIIESTPGFADNILPDQRDFDFKGLGLR